MDCGKSGTKLYKSYDKMFVIKSLQSEEVEFMHTLLKKYHPVSGFYFKCYPLKLWPIRWSLVQILPPNISHDYLLQFKVVT